MPQPLPELTIEVLAQILNESAGEGEDPGPDGGFADVPFSDLGYDSLAVLETAGRLRRDYGVHLTDDEVSEAGTPQSLLDLARRRISASAS
ncbi:acyl carrier protein [Streptomyces triticirhizae]|uniref:Acyl carrier protein n=1 Tax=Streptomyces triticirhizae TaxID=2483353 RepID=A0A3M2LNN0_9ACTN|nr:acyl carrier protein [Streptomyces triticirhizae]RMI36408.1 acyl carrier protein [Streptomyces triticirhizae]